MSAFDLTSLEAIIAARAQAESGSSYTRQLLERGPAACAKKLGEEAVEAALAAVLDERQNLVNEAADVLYHLMVVLKSRNVALSEVYDELLRRTAQSGLNEKASREAKT
jgi:phosphoribosyl-ATP pyrophosphohydrolase